MRNKGSLADLTLLILGLAFLVILGFFGAKIYDEFNTNFSEIIEEGGRNTTQTNNILSNGDTSTSVFISMIPFAIIGMGLVALVLAFLVPVHPIFMPISIIALLLYEVVAITFSNFLWEFINTTEFLSIANQHALLVDIIQFLPHIVGVFGFIIVVVLHRTSQAGGQL